MAHDKVFTYFFLCPSSFYFLQRPQRNLAPTQVHEASCLYSHSFPRCHRGFPVMAAAPDRLLTRPHRSAAGRRLCLRQSLGRSGPWSRQGAPPPEPQAHPSSRGLKGTRQNPVCPFPSQARSGLIASPVPVFLHRQPQVQDSDDSRPNYA